jgi:hypothetical protein
MVVSMRSENGAKLENCSSLALFDHSVCFNVEKKSAFGDSLTSSAEHKRITVTIGSIDVICEIISVVPAGDHHLVLAKQIL